MSFTISLFELTILPMWNDLQAQRLWSTRGIHGTMSVSPATAVNNQ